MAETAAAAETNPSKLGQRWGLAMAALFVAMLGLFAWIWQDLDHRIAAGREREVRTGKTVGPDRLKSPREHAVAHANAALEKAPPAPKRP